MQEEEESISDSQSDNIEDENWTHTKPTIQLK